MKNNRVIKILYIFIILSMFLMYIPEIDAANLGTNELFKINGKTIKNNTNLEELISMFGEPVVTTESAFGGEAYSFCDDTKLWYAHVETDSNGTIRGYGAIGGDFVGKNFIYGDEDYLYGYFQGIGIANTDDYLLYGAYEYNGLNASLVSDYWTRYYSDSSKYLYNMQKHSVEAAKVYAKRNGKEFEHSFPSEDVFYINEQLKLNGSDYLDYAKNNGRTNELYEVTNSPTVFNYSLPNPVYIGHLTEENHQGAEYEYVLYDLQMKSDVGSTNAYSFNGVYKTLYIKPEFIAKRNIVELTEEENSKIQQAMTFAQSYKEKNNEFKTNYSSYFEETPTYTELPLVAGSVHLVAREAATDYINMIRSGAGLSTLELDDNISEAAQHKAALVRYINNYSGLGVVAGHYPEKFEGLDDAFYNKAQSYMSNENLYMGNVIESVAQALNDSYGDPMGCSHRYSLLNPSVTRWGLGHVGAGSSFNTQSVHKFDGNTVENTQELIAWPSNGVTPYSIFKSPGLGNWSARFYKGYDISSCSMVTIKNLATNTVIRIEKNNLSEGQRFETVGDTQITYYDSNVSVAPGDVFEITFSNVIKGEDTLDYTYRAVVYDFLDEEIDDRDIELSKNNVHLTVGKQERVFAYAKPDTAKDKLMSFESLDESIATVRKDGNITAVSAGETTIIVKYGNVQKEITVTVVDYEKGDVNQDGVVNVEDAAMVLDIYKGTVDLTEIRLYLGDMDDSGTLDVQDAGMILDKFKGLF